jgi:hypothetical protein
MERQQHPSQAAGGGGGGALPDGADALNQFRAEANGILDEADRVLDSIQPHRPEDYELKLHRSRQRGGQ